MKGVPPVSGDGGETVMLGPGLPHLSGVIFPEKSSMPQHNNNNSSSSVQNDIVEESFDDQELGQQFEQQFNLSPGKRRVHNLPVKSNGERLGQLKGGLVARGQLPGEDA